MSRATTTPARSSKGSRSGRIGSQLTLDDVQKRVRTVLRWQLANGVQFVRSHVDVCDPELRAVRALIELRKEIRGR